MKMKVIIVNVPHDRTEVEIDGELDAAKTYVKLLAKKNFNWGVVERTDKLKPGDVNRWLIQRNTMTGEMSLLPFSFFEVDAEINLNAMRGAFSRREQFKEIHKVLGGGPF